MSNPVTASIVARLRTQHAAQIKQSAEDNGGVSDPNDRGTTTIPKDEKSNPALAAMPQNADGTPAARNDAGNIQPLHAGLNAPVPATGDQNAKDDAATAPTTELSKIAGNLKNILTKWNTPAQAPAAEPKTAGQTPAATGWDPAVLQKMAADLGIDPQTIASMTPEAFGEFTRTKLANAMAMILQVEGGADAVGELLEKKAGIDEARAVMQQAVNSYALFSQEASYEQKQAAAHLQEIGQVQNALAQRFNQLTAGATQQDITKMAHYEAVINEAAGKLDAPCLQAFLNGMKRAAADVEGIEQGMDPSALEQGQNPPPAPGDDQGGPPMQGDGGDVSELEQALQMALEQGKITPEMAAQIIQELQGAMGGEGGPPPQDDGSGAPPADVPPEAAAADDIKAACAGLGFTW